MAMAKSYTVGTLTTVFSLVFCILMVVPTLPASTNCSLKDAKDNPIYISHGDWLIISCLHYHDCSGQYIIEHLNHNTSRDQYELILQTRLHRANVTIEALDNAGLFRCSKRCSDEAQDSSYCYINVVVKPTILEWDSSFELINENHVSCSATGYPAPLVDAIVHVHQNCSINYTCNYSKVDNYTGKALITFTKSGVSMDCSSVKIDCYSVDIKETQIFNITNVQEDIPLSPPTTMSTELIVTPKMNTTVKDASSHNTPRMTLLLTSIIIVLCIHQ